MRQLGILHTLISLAALAVPCAAQDEAAVRDADEVCYATADANCSGEGEPTLGDLSIIMDYFFISGGTLMCPWELDLNGDCVINWDDYLLLQRCFSGWMPPPGFPDPCGPVETCCNPAYNNSCCVGFTGNANGDESIAPTMGDISTLIDFVFMDGDPSSIECLYEADVNQSGGCTPTYGDITLGDISLLIEVLYICNQDCRTPECLICP